jgi:hypothetical protein
MSQDDEAKRTIWAQRTAQQIVDGGLTAAERYSAPDQHALLREIARRALWHLPNSSDEIRDLARHFYLANLRKPQPGDDDVPDEPPWS